MQSATTEEVEDIKDLLLREALQRRSPAIGGDEPPSDLKLLAEEIRNFADKVASAAAKPVEVSVAPAGIAVPASTEIPELIREMKKFNSAVVSILSQPDVPTITPTYVPPSPIVNVAAPSVSVTPSIRIEQPARRWRFTVTQRDNTAQMRIKEIIVESLE